MRCHFVRLHINSVAGFKYSHYVKYLAAMQSLTESKFLTYNSDTLEFVRKEHGIDKTIRMIEMLDILEAWIQKQQHFVVKSLPRRYLERIIIFNKGSLERTKQKLDKICTLRSLIPELFEDYDIQELSRSEDNLMDIVLPKMTPDHCRVHLFQARTTKMDATKVSQYMKLFLIVSDYVQLYDYNNGLMYLADWRGGSAIDFTMSVNFTQFRTILDTAFEGYSMRIKAIHILTDSKPMTALVMLFKQVMSAKISSRIQVHNTLDTVYEYIPKSVLPVEYGGEDRTVRELRDEFIEELCSEYFKDYRKQINKARTDENFRSKDLFNSEYMGMSGTFRNLSVD